MSIKLVRSTYIFGVVKPEPRIHDHETVMEKGAWVRAHRDGVCFFVEDLGGDWRLRPVIQRDGRETAGRPAKIIPKHLGVIINK